MKLYKIGILADKTTKMTGETAPAFLPNFNVTTQIWVTKKTVFCRFNGYAIK